MKLNKSVQMAIGMLAMITMAQGSAGTAVAAEGEKRLASVAFPQSDSSPSTALSGATDFTNASIFQPPSAQDIPKNEFGQTVKIGRDIFEHTKRYASQYVGKDSNLNCSSCHLDAGRLADSSPLWAAYVNYPAYRSKNKHVNTFSERLQGCFKYSMNGKAPPLGDPVLVALESYAYWLASGATIAANIPGRGYPSVPKPPLERDYGRGQQMFEQSCALCHGAGKSVV